VPAGAEVIDRVKQAVSRLDHLDSITLAGNSEPTAHPEFPQIVEGLRKFREEVSARWRIKCLSNGSELDRSGVVSACDRLDEIWVKLDCAEEDLFRRLNRPISELASVSRHIERVKNLKFPRIQTLLWTHPAMMQLRNFTEANLDALLSAYARIPALEVHVTTVARATALKDLRPLSWNELCQFRDRIRGLGIPADAFL
jgi:wyosine [tRNA(Phe)-imidazoG37] synthetase (radical SAM superfamily)